MSGQTVMELEHVFVQEIFPTSFGIHKCDRRGCEYHPESGWNAGTCAVQ